MAITTYKHTPEQLFSATSDGLDIIHKYLPKSIGCENKTKKFKYREEEKTASATLFHNGKHWIVVDHGGESRNAIAVVMDLCGLEFKDALQRLCEEFNLTENNTLFKAEVEIKENVKNDLYYFNIKFKKKLENAEIIGRFITPELASEYNFYSVDYYEKVIVNKETGKNRLIKVIATDNFPIFAYTPDAKEWVKLYSPLDKKYKHSYLGKKPERYVHGLQRFKNKVKSIQDEIAKENRKKEPNEFVIENLMEELQNLQVFICSGGTDGLNLASLHENYFAIWFNSEAEQITYNELQEFKFTDYVYNVPDIDKSGRKYGYEVAKKHWNLKSIWLPAEKMIANGKDFRDWLAFYKNADKVAIHKQFQNLITGALKCKFFDDKRSRNGITYNLNLSNLHYFLNVHDFYTYKIEQKHIDISGEDQVIFIRLEGNIVYKVSPREIRRFCLAYVREKGQPLEVSNKILSSPYFNENHLSGLEDIKLDFTNFDADTQYFFFENQVAKVSNERVEFKKHGTFDNYAWNKQIVKHTITEELPFFEHYKDDLGNDRIKILRTDCDFQNYLINASRTYWKKDLEDSFKNELEAEKYHNENRFNLNGSNLTEAEQIIQEKHFLNKCFSLGYILHRYKQEDFAKCLYVMDDTPKESDEDANGRTGKSVMFKGVDKLLQNRFLIDGKNRSITQDRHIFHGLYDTNEYIQIDDADKYLDFKFFYTKITNSIIVNPKNSQPYEIPFEVAPKIVYITNYGMPNMTGSDFGRILFVSFSDYYHAKTEHYQQERRISHDFNGRNLFQSWDKKQWNIFYNFMLQCCQLYLQNRGKEFQAPQDNITINNLRAGMGENFEEWANSYFTDEMFNVNIYKDVIYESYKKHAGKYAQTATTFKKSLRSWTLTESHNRKLQSLSALIFNPKDLANKQGRFIESNLNPDLNDGKKSREFIHIRTEDYKGVSVVSETPQVEPDLFDEELKDDLPF